MVAREGAATAAMPTGTERRVDQTARAASPYAVWVPVEGSRYSGWRLGVKRVIDVVGSVLGLVLLSPLYLVIGVAIRATSRGPAVFVHDRLGRGGQPFRMLKLRTMHTEAEELLREDPELHQRYVANGFKLQVEEDPRVTPLGRFLRRSSLDELPQLWNVLKGDMSLVGPRPIVAEELVMYGRLRGAYLEPRPGLTGRWQVEGRSQVGYPQRAELDADYLTTWGLWADASLCLRTLPTVISRRGAT